MRMLQSILFVTDFNPASASAIPMAARLASVFGARISVLHVMEPHLPVAVSLHRQENVVQLLDETRAQFERLDAQVSEVLLVTGPVIDSIVRKANEMNADLIVIGSGKMSPDGTCTVGPVAQSVIEHAVQPVLAVRSGSSNTTFKTILCPVDHSNVSRHGLRNAIRLAKVLESRLVVLSVVPEVSWLTAAAETGVLTDAKGEYIMNWSEELASFLSGINFDGVAYTRELRSGVPHEQIVAVAKEHQADLVIMGATGRTGLVRVLLGSTTRRILRNLPCSLLTVKDEDVLEDLFEEDMLQIAELMNEGQALKDAGSDALAAEKFRQVLAYNPFHVTAVECLAEASEKLGRTQEAESYRRRARRLQEKS